MIKVIFHVVRAAIAAVTALLFFSCGLDNFKKIDGSGNVVAKNRPAQEEFTSIEVSNNFEVIIEQGAVRSVVLEADDNFHEHIKTEIKGGELEITSDAGFRNGTARVIVTMPKIEKIDASASAAVRSKSSLKVDEIDLSASSGASMEITVDAKQVTLESGSGGNLNISGKTDDLQTDSSSGGHINAKGLTAKNVDAESSSGGHTIVNAVESLTADASSGGHILYTTTPNELDKKTSSGGSVSQE